MRQGRAMELIVSAVAGFIGAGVFSLLLHNAPAQGDNETIVSAHEFQLLSSKNQIVGRWAANTHSQLPFLSLEGPETIGERYKKDGTLFIGFHAGVPQIRLHGAERKGGIVLSVFEETSHASIIGRGENNTLHFDPIQADTWNKLLKSATK